MVPSRFGEKVDADEERGVMGLQGKAASARLISIVGPTAVGKTQFAIQLAERLDGEIVNADALQVYRGLAIGTAKPSAGEQARVRHHLLDVLAPEESFSAGDFARRARTVTSELLEAGKSVLLVGGSGLYRRAFFEGLDATPRTDPEARRRWKEELQHKGAETLHRELARRCPAAARRIHRRDGHRIVRALENCTGSDSFLADSEKHDDLGPYRPPGAVATTCFGLTLPRALLYDQIESRVHQMLTLGWEREVRDLIREGVSQAAPAFQAIGYREILRVIQGEASRGAAARDIALATRRYAKRQLTWFRREPDIRWLDARRSLDLVDPLSSSVQST